VRSSRPGAPGHAPLVDFCNRNDPQARPSDPETQLVWRPLDFHRAPRPRSRSAFRWGRRRFPDDDSVEAEPRIHGSGAVGARPSFEGPAGLPRRDGSLRRLRPNPIGSNTSCRATRADYDRSTVIGIAERAREPSERIRGLAPGDPLARGLPRRAASRTPSRKGDAFRRTRGAFRRKTPLAGSALVHSL